MFSASKSGLSSVPDPQFNYVTALLHGDGTNGAQNTSFVDGSTNNYTITTYANVTQGSFSPYGSLWSNVFGNSSNLTFTGTTAMSFGTGDFTIEAWVYKTATTGDYAIIDSRATGSGEPWYLWIVSNNLQFYTGSNTLTSSNSISLNTWTHVAVSRTSGVLKLFVGGVQGYSASNTDTINVTANTYIASRNDGVGSFQGYISNLRIIKGTGIYTSAFTPPTTPLTAVSGTQLLTCQSNRFIDNSSNNFTLTVVGTPSVQRFNPFLPTSSQAYTTSVYGGSEYCDGNQSYVSAPVNAGYFGTGNFTIECWVYPTTISSSSNVIAGIWEDLGPAHQAWILVIGSSGQLQFSINASLSGPNITIFSGATNDIRLNQWQHIAITRSGNNWYKFINGKLSESTTNTTSIYNSAGYLGVGYYYHQVSTGAYIGYISDFRTEIGTAVYTSAFTPPTAPLTAITNTSLLLNFKNAGIYDNAMMNDFITAGSAQISTSVKKYGTGSLSFNGSTDFLVQTFRPFMLWNSANLTIEFWINTTSSTQYATIYSNTQASFSTGMYSLMINSQSTTSGDVTLFVNEYSSATPLIVTTSNSVRDGNWHHVAMVRNGSSWVIYVNGLSSGTGTFSGSITATTYPANIGSDPFYSRNFGGYIDDFRITYGYARYTSNFTPPTYAFPNY